MTRLLLTLLLTVPLPVSVTAAADQDDLLPPEQAFELRGQMLDANLARFEWEIADGYYLYRSKVRIQSESDALVLGEPDLPNGIQKKDDYFGEVEIYRDRLQVDIPIEHRDPDGPAQADFIVKSQGCADVGVCYPPQATRLTLALPPVSPAVAAPVLVPAVEDSPLPSLSPATPEAALLGVHRDAGDGLLDFGKDAPGADPGTQTTQGDDFLDPDQAFVVSAQMAEPAKVVVLWSIADGYYLYRHRLKFELVDAAGHRLGAPDVPSGEQKEDEFFGTVETYHHQLRVELPLSPPLVADQELTLAVGYQGCAEAGLCYPPQHKDLPLFISAAGAAPVASSDVAPGSGEAPSVRLDEPASTEQAVPKPAGGTAPVSESDSIANTLAGGNTWIILLTFLGFGLLLTFTPCVFPMIPILSSIIVGQGSSLNTGRAFVMSLVYVLAMALTYTVAGVIAGVAGSNLQAAFQNPWVLGSFATLFVLLALSMFGFYELQLPSSLQSRLTEASNRQQGGTLVGVAVMGLLSALIVGPCVAPPLMGALIYIGNSGDAVLGGMALFAMSLGMGMPLLVIGTLGGKWLPRAGAWMDAVKAVFGVMLLAVAIWMLERVLPGPVSLLLWATLLLVSAVYMGALDSLQGTVSGWRRLVKGLGLVFLVYGVLLLVGAATGGDDLFRPLHALRGPVGADGGGMPAAAQVSFERVDGLEDLDKALAQAAGSGKPVLLDFYADWCVECKRMERYTFAEPRVAAALEGVRLLQADVTDNNDTDRALLQHFGLLGPPALIFFGRDGREMRAWRFVGFKDADAFVAHANGAFRPGP